MTSWKKIEINTNTDETGMLSVIEQDNNFDFDVKRVFLVSGVEASSVRGEHAHRELKQIIFAASGSLKITLNNGISEEEFILTQGDYALYVDGMVWRTMRDFSSDAVLMVLCDRIYKDDVVIRDYDEFKRQL